MDAKTINGGKSTSASQKNCEFGEICSLCVYCASIPRRWCMQLSGITPTTTGIDVGTAPDIIRFSAPTTLNFTTSHLAPRLTALLHRFIGWLVTGDWVRTLSWLLGCWLGYRPCGFMSIGIVLTPVLSLLPGNAASVRISPINLNVKYRDFSIKPGNTVLFSIYFYLYLLLDLCAALDIAAPPFWLVNVK